MYYERVLSTAEALFVSRAQQRIAELTALMADQYQRNDVDEFNAQICQELQYAVLALKSTFLDWTEDEIQMVMDYYTIHAKLITFGFRSIIFDPICSIAGGQVWATIQQLNLVESNSVNYDAYLLQLIQQLDIDYQAGDTILQTQINNLITGNNTLVAELTADISVGGIAAGTVFPIGTSLEAIWNQLLGVRAEVSNLSFNTYVEFMEEGDPLLVSNFTWNAVGSPQNLTLSDTAGELTNEPVVGENYSPTPITYTALTGAQDVTWTLDGDNVEPITTTVKWRFLTYYGKEATADDDPVTVTEAKVLAGISQLSETATEIVVAVDTANTEQGFIAVHKSQTAGDYTQWFVDNTNFSNILVGEFILPPVDVTVNGETFSVYRWGYRSPLTDDLKLHR